MNKEECKKMIEKLPMLMPIKEEYGYGCSMTEFDEMIDFVHELYTQLYGPKPYKFEDLKPNMWVWDDVEKKCNKIIEILENKEISFYYITENVSRYIVKFEENRFYPVTKVMELKNE